MRPTYSGSKFRAPTPFRRRQRPPIAQGLIRGCICAACLLTAACVPPTGDALIGADGSPVRLEAVTEIVNSEELTEQQKNQQLSDLGITDEQLVALLIREAANLP